MALPQKALDRLSQAESITPGWSFNLFMFGVTLFFVAIVVYLGIAFGYTPILNSQLADLDQEIKALGDQIPLEQQKELIKFYSQITNVRTLIKDQAVFSSFLKYLEANTHVNVQFTRLSLDKKGGQLSLSGFARTMKDVGEQVQQLQSRPEADMVLLKSVSEDTTLKKVQFELSVFLKDSIIKGSKVGTGSVTSTQ